MNGTGEAVFTAMRLDAAVLQILIRCFSDSLMRRMRTLGVHLDDLEDGAETFAADVIVLDHRFEFQTLLQKFQHLVFVLRSRKPCRQFRLKSLVFALDG